MSVTITDGLSTVIYITRGMKYAMKCFQLLLNTEPKDAFPYDEFKTKLIRD